MESNKERMTTKSFLCWTVPLACVFVVSIIGFFYSLREDSSVWSDTNTLCDTRIRESLSSIGEPFTVKSDAVEEDGKSLPGCKLAYHDSQDAFQNGYLVETKGSITRTFLLKNKEDIDYVEKESNKAGIAFISFMVGISSLMLLRGIFSDYRKSRKGGD